MGFLLHNACFCWKFSRELSGLNCKGYPIFKAIQELFFTLCLVKLRKLRNSLLLSSVQNVISEWLNIHQSPALSWEDKWGIVDLIGFMWHCLFFLSNFFKEIHREKFFSEVLLRLTVEGLCFSTHASVVWNRPVNEIFQQRIRHVFNSIPM